MIPCPREKQTGNQRGALVVTSLILTLALAVIGTLTIMITVTERSISRNHKMAKDVFYIADGGHPLAVTIIEDILAFREGQYSGFTLEGNLKNEVMGYHQDTTSLNDGSLDSPKNTPDIQGTVDNQPVCIDIDRLYTALLYGGSAEFAAGSEGTGSGDRASKKLLFAINSEGYVQGGATANVITTYRKVL